MTEPTRYTARNGVLYEHKSLVKQVCLSADVVEASAYDELVAQMEKACACCDELREKYDRAHNSIDSLTLAGQQKSERIKSMEKQNELAERHVAELQATLDVAQNANTALVMNSMPLRTLIWRW